MKIRPCKTYHLVRPEGYHVVVRLALWETDQGDLIWPKKGILGYVRGEHLNLNSAANRGANLLQPEDLKDGIYVDVDSPIEFHGEKPEFESILVEDVRRGVFGLRPVCCVISNPLQITLEYQRGG